jgi:hypothetical protein
VLHRLRIHLARRGDPGHLEERGRRADVRIEPAARCRDEIHGDGRRIAGVGGPQCIHPVLHALTSAGFVGLRFEPDEAPALSGNGEVADGRAQKYFGSSKGCPIRLDPTSLPSLTIRLPLAWDGKITWAIPVTISG